jgi:hypothetical protein
MHTYDLLLSHISNRRPHPVRDMTADQIWCDCYNRISTSLDETGRRLLEFGVTDLTKTPVYHRERIRRLRRHIKRNNLGYKQKPSPYAQWSRHVDQGQRYTGMGGISEAVNHLRRTFGVAYYAVGFGPVGRVRHTFGTFTKKEN